MVSLIELSNNVLPFSPASLDSEFGGGQHLGTSLVVEVDVEPVGDVVVELQTVGSFLWFFLVSHMLLTVCF